MYMNSWSPPHASTAKNATLDCIYDSLMHRRRVLVETTCRELFRNGTRQQLTIAAENIFAMIRRRLLWCPVYKAGSTNWMKNMVKLSQHSPQHISIMAAKKEWGQSNTLARYLKQRRAQ
jgi:hypothetical protein